MGAQRFQATLERRPRGGMTLRLPFDPDVAWGERDPHHVSGTVGGIRVRGALARDGAEARLELGPAWCRDASVGAGDHVAVVLEPEGPQFETLAPDIREAFDASPGTRRAFESLPTFYRNGFVRAIEEARRPETRARRIADTVAALEAGRREL